ncbi:prolyl oligopeptidase family serine peptidase [Olsenella porci]|nr:prolyl oligopeptidase family serine peptidase [Olsenella porci]
MEYPFSRRRFLGALMGMSVGTILSGCSRAPADGGANVSQLDGGAQGPASSAGIATEAKFTQGSRVDRGFVVDDSLDVGGRTLHFSLHVPDGYDGSAAYRLYVSCPGWEGLYFQGVGANLVEDFPFVANDYIPNMIVASPQLDDWGQQSADDVVALTEWLLATYNIDAGHVYLSGNSGGGETISLVLGQRPDLYRRALHTISRWDGNLDVLTDAQVPVYMAIGLHDDYYGSDPDRATYQQICDAYRQKGLTDAQISELVVLDVKPDSYFTDHGRSAGASQHAGGGALFPHDSDIMGWLFRD